MRETSMSQAANEFFFPSLGVMGSRKTVDNNDGAIMIAALQYNLFCDQLNDIDVALTCMNEITSKFYS